MKTTRTLFQTLLMLLLCYGSSFAQTNKGTSSLGMNFNFQQIKSPGSTSAYTLFSLAPEMGWFLKDNLELGFRPTLSYSKFGTSSTLSLGYSLGAFARQYLPRGDGRFGFWLSEYAYMGGDFSGTGTDLKQRVWNYGININPGIYYFVTQQFAATLQAGDLGFLYTRNTVSGGYRLNADLSSSSVRLGLRYFIFPADLPDKR